MPQANTDAIMWEERKKIVLFVCFFFLFDALLEGLAILFFLVFPALGAMGERIQQSRQEWVWMRRCE